MKKFFNLLFIIMIFSVFSGCSFAKHKTSEKKLKYNDLRVTFVTTQGDVSFYLYPDAAPLTVANFINLAKRGFFDNNKIHRAVDNFVVQAGDPTGTGQGGPGYAIPDEFVSWLDFYQPGMLAMANKGPNTGGSQFFFTMAPADWLNGKHTVFGEYISEKDLNTIKKLEVGDVIKTVKFEGNVDLFLSIYKDQIEQWNQILDQHFPNLRKYPIKDKSAYGSQVEAYYQELEALRTPKVKENKPWFGRRMYDKIKNKVSKEN